MSRNDAILSNAMSSSNAGGLRSRASLRRKEEADSEKARTAKPDPKATVVLKLIAVDKRRLMSIDAIQLNDKMTDEQKLRQIAQNRRDYDYLCNLERRFRKLLGIEAAAKQPPIPEMPE